jgi:hypothetical protein
MKCRRDDYAWCEISVSHAQAWSMHPWNYALLDKPAVTAKPAFASAKSSFRVAAQEACAHQVRLERESLLRAISCCHDAARCPLNSTESTRSSSRMALAANHDARPMQCSASATPPPITVCSTLGCHTPGTSAPEPRSPEARTHNCNPGKDIRKAASLHSSQLRKLKTKASRRGAEIAEEER